jgi:hypothetical protein
MPADHAAFWRARAGQAQPQWRDDYKRRADIEATISEAVAVAVAVAVTVTGTRDARYRDCPSPASTHTTSPKISLRVRDEANSPPNGRLRPRFIHEVNASDS